MQSRIVNTSMRILGLPTRTIRGCDNCRALAFVLDGACRPDWLSALHKLRNKASFYLLFCFVFLLIELYADTYLPQGSLVSRDRSTNTAHQQLPTAFQLLQPLSAESIYSERVCKHVFLLIPGGTLLLAGHVNVPIPRFHPSSRPRSRQVLVSFAKLCRLYASLDLCGPGECRSHERVVRHRGEQYQRGRFASGVG